MKNKQFIKQHESILDYEPVDLPKKPQYYFELIILFVTSLLASYALLALDVKTDSIADLLSLKMLIPSLVFAIPAFIASSFLFDKLAQSYSTKMSMTISLIVSIPLVFLLLIWFL